MLRHAKRMLYWFVLSRYRSAGVQKLKTMSDRLVEISAFLMEQVTFVELGGVKDRFHSTVVDSTGIFEGSTDFEVLYRCDSLRMCKEPRIYLPMQIVVSFDRCGFFV